jgi:hypothetical protein
LKPLGLFVLMIGRVGEVDTATADVRLGKAKGSIGAMLLGRRGAATSFLRAGGSSMTNRDPTPALLSLARMSSCRFERLATEVIGVSAFEDPGRAF